MGGRDGMCGSLVRRVHMTIGSIDTCIMWRNSDRESLNYRVD